MDVALGSVDSGAGLVGRAAELAWLDERFNDVVVDGAAAVLISGEAGIGKSTLLNAFAERGAPGRRIAIGRCRANDADPYSGMRSLVDGIAGRDVAALLGGEDIGAPLETATFEAAHAERYRAFSVVADALLTPITDTPALLVLDDAHWASPPLRDFLEFLVDEMERRRRALRVMLVVVTRLLPPPHPVVDLLDELARRPRVHRLDVGPLDASSIGRIVDAAAGGPTSSAYQDIAGRSARGNPLRARAIVGVLKQRGVPPLVKAADRRIWHELRVPLSTDDPVGSWVRALDDDVRSSLGHVAVVGDELALADAPRLGVEPEHLDVGISLGMIGTDGEAVWFAHALFREALYDQLPQAERCRTHVLVAEHLRTLASTATRRVAVARHVLAAGALVPSAERADALRVGGHSALELTSWSEAAQLFEAALAAGPADPDAELFAGLGRAYYFDHDLASASTALRRAIALAELEGREELWGTAVFMLLRMQLAASTASWRRPEDNDLARAFLAVAKNPAVRALVLQGAAEAQVAAGRVVEGRLAADEAVAFADESGNASVRALAQYARALADLTDMQITEGAARCRLALAHARLGGDWFTEDTIAARLAFPLVATGEFTEADMLATECVSRARARHEHSNLSLGLNALATSALLRGDFATVDELVPAAAEAGRRANYVMADLFLPPTAFLVHLYRGQADQAERVVEDWPNIPKSGRAGLRRTLRAFWPDPELAPVPAIRPPSLATQVSAGYFVAALDGALATRSLEPGPDVCQLVGQWHAGGLEYPVTYPTSLTRVLAELRAASGDADEASGLFAVAVRMCEGHGAHVEVVRSLAGWARLARDRPDAFDGDPAELERRAVSLARRIGLDLRILGLREQAAPSDPEPASGWRVVMMSDVVGSTAVSHGLGDVAYLELVLRHHAIVRKCLELRGGHEFSEAGDGLLAWFASTELARLAAADIQRETARAAVGPQLRVRIALAGGDPLFHEGRPYGLVLNRAARLVAAARPGQIVVDEAVAAELPAAAIAGSELVELRGIGPHRMAVLVSADSRSHS